MGEQGRPWSSNWGPWSRKVWEQFFCGSQSTYYINKHQIFQRCKSSNNLPQHFYAFSFFQEFSLQKLNSLSVFLTLNKICFSPVDILYVSVVCAVSPPVQCSHVMFVLWYLSPKGGSDGSMKIYTSTMEVIFSPVSICWLVCWLISLSAGWHKNC